MNNLYFSSTNHKIKLTTNAVDKNSQSEFAVHQQFLVCMEFNSIEDLVDAEMSSNFFSHSQHPQIIIFQLQQKHTKICRQKKIN